MIFTVNNFIIIGSLKSILEEIGDIRNLNDKVVGGSDDKNQMECRCCEDCRRGMVKLNDLHLRSTISAMERKV